MKSLKYFALLTVLMVPMAYSQAQVRVGVGVGPVGVGVGVGPGYVAGPPVCEYGYYPDYPYGCAPYGYYGPTYFNSGVFIGAGPWFHRGYYGPGFRYFGPTFNRGFHGGEGFRDFRGGGFRGSVGGGFRGGNQFHSGGGFRGGVSRGGGRR